LHKLNKKKIINDPVHGFISVYSDLIFDIIEHKYYQRLRRIKQLGLTDLVYPGATHTRFHHGLGAMHLMMVALDVLRSKGHEITPKEYEASLIAILLHDIGHGPFSHTLEYGLLNNISHEQMSSILIHKLNDEFNGAIALAIEIFEHKYFKKFLSQLVSSQLDVDRMDYLQRDSYFTGVSEGVIGAERILKLLNVYDNELVVEEKGIHSIENFLNARRLMYWQVYLHKAAISAETMMNEIIRRVKLLIKNAGASFTHSTELDRFLLNDYRTSDFKNNPELINDYCELDDYDIWAALKMWANSNDRIISLLSKMLLNRNLFKIKLSNNPIDREEYKAILKEVKNNFDLSDDDLNFFVKQGEVSNAAYVIKEKTINIIMKDETIEDVAKASDLPNIKALGKIVRKNYLCWPKNVSLRDYY